MVYSTVCVRGPRDSYAGSVYGRSIGRLYHDHSMLMVATDYTSIGRAAVQEASKQGLVMSYVSYPEK